MSDIFFLDEDITSNKNPRNILKEDAFINGELFSEGTAYEVVEESDEV